MVKLSIIIATFNASKTLRNCLDSIVSQLSDEVELLIIDGGSRDTTPDIVASYGNQIDYFISEPDKGIYDAWNKGIKAAHGKWIAFIGADDVLLPHALQHYLHVIHNTSNIDSYDYICSRVEFVNESGILLKVLGEEPSWENMRKRMAPAHVASLHSKTNLFDQVGFYDLSYRICGDYELLLRKRNHLRYLFIDAVTARMQAGGMSFTVKAIRETFKIRKKHHSLSLFVNALCLLRDWFGFKLFLLRKGF